jgi:hypothetical protein
MMRDLILAAAGALLVAVLNELRASIRARQADRDRREQLAAALQLRRMDHQGDPPTEA